MRFLLFPISFIYWIVTSLRNGLYKAGILKSYKIPGKSIVVGNLSVGGTGKSPHVDMIVQHLLNNNKSISTLSRGYGRNTKGFIEASSNSTSQEIGDEPLMFKSKHLESINVTVCEDRTIGIKKIQSKYPKNDVIILDDAFQHRKVNAGLNILISDYSQPFYKDFILPVGRLRESRNGSHRADILIISKCPEIIGNDEKALIAKSSKFDPSKIFYSRIQYDALHSISDEPIQGIERILVVTGIANPKPLLQHLEKHYKVEHISFKDHHEFSDQDIEKIHEKFDTFVGQGNAIVTTEKDYMRLKKFSAIQSKNYQWFYQPIRVVLDRQNEFNAEIDNYVGEI